MISTSSQPVMTNSGSDRGRALSSTNSSFGVAAGAARSLVVTVDVVDDSVVSLVDDDVDGFDDEAFVSVDVNVDVNVDANVDVNVDVDEVGVSVVVDDEGVGSLVVCDNVAIEDDSTEVVVASRNSTKPLKPTIRTKRNDENPGYRFGCNLPSAPTIKAICAPCEKPATPMNGPRRKHSSCSASMDLCQPVCCM